MNVAAGACVRGVEATDITVTLAPGRDCAIDVADASLKTCTFALASSTPAASKFLPVAK